MFAQQNSRYKYTNSANLNKYFKAAAQGDLATIKTFDELYLGLLNIKDREDNNLLHISFANDQIEVAKFISDQDISLVNGKNKQGMSPNEILKDRAFDIVQEGNIELVRLLIENFPTIFESRYDDGITLTHLALLNSEYALAALIAKFDTVLLETKDDNGRSPLEMLKNDLDFSLEINEQDTIRSIGKSFPELIANQLFQSTVDGDLEVISILHQCCPTIFDCVDENGDSLMHVAALYDELEAAALIGRLNSSLKTAKDLGGSTPIQIIQNHMFEAAKNGDYTTISLLDKYFPEVFAHKYENGNSLMHIAIIDKQFELAKHILMLDQKYGFIKNDSGCTPANILSNYAFEACKTGDIKILNELLSKFQHIFSQARDRVGKTPMHIAAENMQLEAFKLLDQDIPNLKNIKDSSGQYPLLTLGIIAWNACKKGDVSVIKAFIKDYPAIFNTRDQLGNNPIHIAAENEHIKIVKLLCEYDQSQSTARNKKAANNFYKHCYDQEADRNEESLMTSKNKEGVSPVDIIHELVFEAEDYDNISSGIERAIKDWGFALSLPNSEGNPFMHSAISLDQFDLVKLIASHNKSLMSSKDNNGATPFHIIARDGVPEDLKYFIKCVDVNILPRDKEGLTPLFYAANSQNIPNLNLLLKISPLPFEVEDINGNKLIHFLVQEEKSESIDFMLRKYPEQVLSMNKDGKLPIHVAIESKKLEFVEKLASLMGAIDNSEACSLMIKAIHSNSGEVVKKVWECFSYSYSEADCYKFKTVAKILGETSINKFFAEKIYTHSASNESKAEMSDDNHSLTYYSAPICQTTFFK